MDHVDVTGHYTYRSLLNDPDPAEDFNKLWLGEGELFMFVSPSGQISGTLAFPSARLEGGKDLMDISGQVTGWSPPAFELRGQGRPGTPTESWDYRYAGSLAPAYEDAVGQRPTLTGTVLRAKPHGQDKAGVTASFVAVKRDFLEPRNIPGVALLPDVVAMLADRRHRLQHMVWHTVRLMYHSLSGSPEAVEKIDKLGWWPQRPPFLLSGALDLGNGAGEDFLFMHRKMILMVRDMYAAAGARPPASWGSLPRHDIPQIVYTRATPSALAFTFAAGPSGNMIPPVLEDPEDPDGEASDRWMKSSAFFTEVMRVHEARFRSPAVLSGMTLGELGNVIEWTIHGWMHMRWVRWAYDSATGKLVARKLFDIDPTWDDPAYDDLSDFYSSHVNPVFWRLHGWVDDRINSWLAANRGRVTAREIDGVPWFEADGDLVKVDEPFYWPTAHHHHDRADADVEAMEDVVRIIKSVVEPSAPTSLADASEPARSWARPVAQIIRDVLMDVSLTA